MCKRNCRKNYRGRTFSTRWIAWTLFVQYSVLLGEIDSTQSYVSYNLPHLMTTLHLIENIEMLWLGLRWTFFFNDQWLRKVMPLLNREAAWFLTFTNALRATTPRSLVWAWLTPFPGISPPVAGGDNWIEECLYFNTLPDWLLRPGPNLSLRTRGSITTIYRFLSP